MTVSPFSVYLILQADSIYSGLIAMFVIPAAILLILRALPLIGWSAAIGKEDEKKWQIKIDKSPGFKWPIMLACAACLVGAFFPSTKVLAGSFIAPAIINSNAVQKDIPELYDLGISALKAALSKPKTTTEK